MKNIPQMLTLVMCLLCAHISAQQQNYSCNSSTTWNGDNWSDGPPDQQTRAIFTGDYVFETDLTVCSIEVSNGASVHFSGNEISGTTLTVHHDISIENGSILSFGNNAALIQIDDNAINTGEITYERATPSITEYDFVYWSSPVIAQRLDSLSPATRFDKYMSFDSATNNWDVILNGNGEMEPAKGYIIRGPDGQNELAPFNAVFKGTPNNGTITFPTLGNGNFNLIGNPYPSAVDADCFLTDSENLGLNGTLYFWTHNVPMSGSGSSGFNYNINDYAVYNLMGGVGSGITSIVNNAVSTDRPTGKIAAGQSFFVSGISSGTSVFRNSMRTAAASDQNSQFFRAAADNATTSPCEIEKHRLWLQIEYRPINQTSALLFKQALIGYAEGATSDGTIDRNFDAPVFTTDPNINLYSLSSAGATTPLTIQGRDVVGAYNPNEIVPLGFTCPTATSGNLTISVSDDDGLFDERKYLLREYISGTGSTAVYAYYDIKNTPHTFSATQQTNNTTRFQLIFAPSGPPLRTASCGQTIPAIYTSLSAIAVSGATQYRFKVTNLSNPFEIQEITTNTNYFQLTDLDYYEYDTTYRIEIAVEVGGIFGNYGPACEVTTPSLFSGPVAINVPQCATTLQFTYSPIFATGPGFISMFRYRVTNVSVTPNITHFVDRNLPWFKLSHLGMAAFDSEFTVEVAVKTTGDWSEFSAPCTIYSPASLSARVANTESLDEVSAAPNPYSSSFALHYSSKKESAHIQIYDLLGRILETRSAAPSETSMAELGTNLPSGVYNVVLTRGETIQTIKIVKR